MFRNLLLFVAAFILISCEKSSNDVCIKCTAYDLINANTIGQPFNQDEQCGSEQELKGWEDKYAARFAGFSTYISCKKISEKDTLSIIRTTTK